MTLFPVSPMYSWQSHHHVIVIVLQELHWCRADDVVQAPVADIVFILKSLRVKILHLCLN
jgi:hypothetical protein